MSDDRLFVGNLKTDVTEQELEAHFSQFGTLKDVFLPKGGQGKPRRIAFVTFEESKSMYTALAQEKQVIGGNEINITKAEPKGAPTPAARGSEGGGRRSRGDSKRIFVNGIPPDTSKSDMEDYFSQWGSLKDVFYNPPKAYAYITFEDERHMFACLSQEVLEVNGSKLSAEIAKPRPQRGVPAAVPEAPAYGQRAAYDPYGAGGAYATTHLAAAAPQRESSTSGFGKKAAENARLFVGNVPSEASKDDLRKHFATFGNVIDLHRPDNKGKSSGVVFVTYGSPKDMFTALAADSHVINNQSMRVTEAQPRPGQGGGGGAPSADDRVEHRVFVGRVPQDVSDADLRSHFAQFGGVEDCYRPRSQKENKEGHGFAFVVFGEAKGMAKTLAAGPSHEIQTTSGNVVLQVKRAAPRPAQSSARAEQPEAAVDPAQLQQYAALYGMNPYVGALPGYGSLDGEPRRERRDVRYQPY